ncbi:hypothetical protein TELCIR_23335 [Teladorsagia circumcincta]|uniref:START domain-containing protein n=1 Tax=Teladorsagia circumcincta TaxID=45464 RepID=A0A2G9TD25_TELCI|nr:hypothetical protein TELCIR_23335 [Teladorsagia circumcincta]
MPPVRGRDFVMQRSWLDTGDEKMICGHSVCHQLLTESLRFFTKYFRIGAGYYRL